MTINYTIDERLDPIRATRAAAELLRDNYNSLGSWPLAITAYNHGDAGMRRAKRRLGTDDIAVIIAKYHSRPLASPRGTSTRSSWPRERSRARIRPTSVRYSATSQRPSTP